MVPSPGVQWCQLGGCRGANRKLRGAMAPSLRSRRTPCLLPLVVPSSASVIDDILGSDG